MEIPFTTTSIYTLILFLEKMGYSLLNGWYWECCKSLEKLMNEEGIKIIKDAEVTEIISSNNKKLNL